MVKSKKGKIAAYLYIVPIMIFCGAFLYYSIGYTVYASFTNWDGITPNMSFAGLANYKSLLTDSVLYQSFLHALLFFIVTQVIQQSLGILFAVFLKSKPYLGTFFKAIVFMPFVMSPIVVGSVFRIILDPNVGSLNNFFKSVHLNFLAVSWLGDPHFVLLAIMFVNIYTWTGFAMVLYYSSLLTIPEDIYEAAKMDGSGFWNTLFKITIPSLLGTMSMQIVLGIIGTLKTFDLVYIMTNGGPGTASEFPTTYLFKKLMQDYNGGMASTVGVIIIIVAMVFSIIQIRASKKLDA
jgi:raffinose/stachyose/melibiose transport system permease protein